MNTLSRIVRCRELLEDGALGELAAVLSDLEHDLAGEQGLSSVDNLACPECGLRVRWPGQLDHHQRFAHWKAAA